MSIVTVGDDLGWSCDALISLRHAIRDIARRADRSVGEENIDIPAEADEPRRASHPITGITDRGR